MTTLRLLCFVIEKERYSLASDGAFSQFEWTFNAVFTPAIAWVFTIAITTTLSRVFCIRTGIARTFVVHSFL